MVAAADGGAEDLAATITIDLVIFRASQQLVVTTVGIVAHLRAGIADQPIVTGTAVEAVRAAASVLAQSQSVADEAVVLRAAEQPVGAAM